jgi:hypothetical protein
MDLTTLVAAFVPLLFVLYWLMGLVKDITNQNWNGIITRVGAFIVAFGVVNLYAHSKLEFGGADVIADLPWQALALAALAIAAGGGTLNDTFRTFNHSDSNVIETLIPPHT